MRKYTIVPMPTGPFQGLDPLSRLAFGLIWDRLRLSSYNTTGNRSQWIDEETGAVYCFYPQQDLAQDMGCSERTARRCMHDLERARIISTRRADYGRAYRITTWGRIEDYMRSDD